MEPIETERLLIRAFTMEDVENVHREVYASADVWGPKSRVEVKEGVLYAMLMSRHADDGAWAKRAVVLKDSDVFIGQVRLSPSYNWFYRWEEEPAPLYNKVEVELAFAFGKAYWGKSYAYEASRAMIHYAFAELKLPRLVGGTGADNLRSINLHRRLGYRIYEALPIPGHDWGAGVVAVLDNELQSENDTV